MSEIFRVNPGNIAVLIPIIAICGGLLVAIVSVIMGNWRKARKHEFDAHLKSQMIEKGMSADEIERVLAAGKTKLDKAGWCE